MPIDNLEDKDIVVARLQAAAHVAAAYRHVCGTTLAAMTDCHEVLETLLKPVNEWIEAAKIRAATGSQTES